ncbi:hypothetical protein THRCLA_07431 [Thraustotheca clavata]|uniref:Mei2-like C-terminal RNA recognition motif domain-containing protein n=1 Tax=Thraustotheca clavata TaxID=74557 RepID=A0A1V9ZD90_9STRA|nr:hypothetical protein THRCLA_07431 [Thraustotheca clavata]
MIGAVCCRCFHHAIVSCVDCDLVYCVECSEQRHKKGSFLRHFIKNIESMCEECLKVPAVLSCGSCELSYCEPCSKEIHRDGTLQGHGDMITPLRQEMTSPFQSPFSTTSIESPFAQKRWSISTDSLDGDSEHDLWMGWNVFGDQRLSETSNQSKWANPACDGMSTSSDDDTKPSSISDAFRDLALSHSSSYSSDDGLNEPFLKSTVNASLSVWDTPSYSQNELEDLLAVLTSRLATRHVAVRSSTSFSPSQCSLVYHRMNSYGEIAQSLTTLAKHGVLLYTFYEVKSAMQAVEDRHMGFTVEFAGAYDTPSPKTHGCVDIQFASNYDPHVVTLDDLHLICCTLGEVIAVANGSCPGRYTVQFNDSRVVPRALLLLEEKGNLGDQSFTVSRSPLSAEDSKRISVIQAREADNNSNPANSPDKPIHFLSNEGIWADNGLTYNRRSRVSSTEEAPNHSPPPSSPPTDEFSLGLDRVYSGQDKRTTLMIRNIPNKYTQSMLLAEINNKHHGTYDFFYLPIDFKNKCNMGYAFINFMSCDAIGPFYVTFNGQRWPNFNSDKVCAISYARLQGKAAMIARFQNSSLLDKHESYRPLVFKSTGPNKGTMEPFPTGKQTQSKSYKTSPPTYHADNSYCYGGYAYPVGYMSSPRPEYVNGHSYKMN